MPRNVPVDASSSAPAMANDAAPPSMPPTIHAAAPTGSRSSRRWDAGRYWPGASGLDGNSVEEDAAHFQALALSGGGFRGLYTAQLLADLEQHLGQPAATRFDLIAGTSIGGILALALACEIPAARIVSLFQDHGAEIFRRRSLFGYFKSKYASTPLQSLLADSSLFGERQLGECLHPVLVPAINYTTGKPVVFKTAHHSSFQTDKHFRLVDVALATSAAPTYFPRHVFNNCQYVDGGLFANAPGILALHEAEFYFGRSPEHVEVLRHR